MAPTDPSAPVEASRQETGAHLPNPSMPPRNDEPALTPEQAKLAAAIIRGDDPYQGDGQSGAHDALLDQLDEIAGNPPRAPDK